MNYVQFAMETNQFQEFLSQELQRRSAEAGVYVSVDDIHHSTDKLGRIQSLQPLVRSGTLRLSRRHVTLLDQLRQFPLAAHDRRARSRGCPADLCCYPCGCHFESNTGRYLYFFIGTEAQLAATGSHDAKLNEAKERLGSNAR